jgi:hypothetical protein
MAGVTDYVPNVPKLTPLTARAGFFGFQPAEPPDEILVSHGIAFPWPNPDHFRFVILPSETYIKDAINRIATLLTSYRTKTHVTVDVSGNSKLTGDGKSD